MTDITIIGSGNMARAIGTRAVAAGRSLQILSRSAEHAADLAAELGADTTSGGLGDIPEGDIVVLALYFGPAKEVATHYGDTLSGKTVVEISNPIDADPSIPSPSNRGPRPPRKSPPCCRAQKWSRPSTPRSRDR